MSTQPSSSSTSSSRAPTHTTSMKLVDFEETAPTPVKPCCVCKDEKAARDKCMLFSDGDRPQEKCKTTIEMYRSCMAGYGFKLPEAVD